MPKTVSGEALRIFRHWLTTLNVLFCIMQVGIVQTAYANGASTAFLSALPGCSTKVTPTGVKHLHAAAEAFDVGIYFEANGHGTVLFSEAFLSRIDQVDTVHACDSSLRA